jgi:hypothetical protein
MPRPKRSNKTEETKSTSDVEKAATTNTDEKPVDLSEQEAKMKALEDLKKKQEEIDELREQLKAANRQVEEKDARNSDFDEKPPPGEYFYYRVKFHPKRNEYDTNEAACGVNGDWLTWPRGVETVLRSDYREALEHAFHQKFTVLPGQSRKEVGGIQVYTFDILGKISKEQYEAKLAEGNNKMKEAIERGDNN